MRVLLSSHTLAISSTCEVWFPVNRGERNESRIAVTPDPSVFLEGLARETTPKLDMELRVFLPFLCV